MGVPEADRLLETAMRLFAELGYDGTSLQLVADAAGVDVAAVHAAVGDGRGELYRAVMRHALEAEGRALQPALDAFTGDLPGYLRLVDAYLDFYAQRTDVLALWLHRWMGDAADVPGLAEDFTSETSLWVVETMRSALPPDMDADHLIWTVVWCVFGFLSGGMIYTDPEARTQEMRGQGIGPPDRERVERFRTHLHKVVTRMFGPPPA